MKKSSQGQNKMGKELSQEYKNLKEFISQESKFRFEDNIKLREWHRPSTRVILECCGMEIFNDIISDEGFANLGSSTVENIKRNMVIDFINIFGQDKNIRRMFNIKLFEVND